MTALASGILSYGFGSDVALDGLPRVGIPSVVLVSSEVLKAK